MKKGWECPRCETVHAPSVMGCNCDIEEVVDKMGETAVKAAQALMEKAQADRDEALAEIKEVVPLLRRVHYIVERTPLRGPGMAKVIVYFRELSQKWKQRLSERAQDDEYDAEIEKLRSEAGYGDNERRQ